MINRLTGLAMRFGLGFSHGRAGAGSHRRRPARLQPSTVTVVLTLVSLSRSALAAQLIVILFAWIGTSTNFRTVLRAFLAVTAVVVAGFAAVVLYAPLHNRFVSGDQAKVAGISLNVTGRDKLWSANWHWFTQKPEIGWGAGSSDRMTSALPGQFAAHPHNDYLRLLVDFVDGHGLMDTACMQRRENFRRRAAGASCDARRSAASRQCFPSSFNARRRPCARFAIVVFG